ncbi:metallophosphoesterase [Thalassomonas sp. M1454]|uniref:metallophosphoesterase n=1 Tax=Thalassomonas sp. M1454 TaxID=2594477 RepID=UPI0021B13ACC|nr:metallophosphoesterase [Thalassomonas sp. M1454]
MNFISQKIIPSVLLLVCTTTVALAATTNTISDGPYISYADSKLAVNAICNGAVVKNSLLKSLDTNRCFNQFNKTTSVLSEHVRSPLIYQGNFDVIAVSDFHGQYDLMLDLLVNNNVIDQEYNWNFGNGHLVITGDVFDRGDKVTEILWLLYKLEQQAKKASGNIHLLLGNHEVMVLNGDLRYLHNKYEKVSVMLNTPFAKLYSKDSVLGQWLRSKNVLVKINSQLFAHGGFHPDLVQQKLTLAQVNEVFVNNLVKNELANDRSELATYLHKTNGPIWYRGYFREPKASVAQIDSLLKHFSVSSIIVGHTSMPQIESHFNGKVIAIDSSIKKGVYGELLLIQGDKKSRLTLSGEQLPLKQI